MIQPVKLTKQPVLWRLKNTYKQLNYIFSVQPAQACLHHVGTSYARLTCSVINILTTPHCRYQLLAIFDLRGSTPTSEKPKLSFSCRWCIQIKPPESRRFFFFSIHVFYTFFGYFIRFNIWMARSFRRLEIKPAAFSMEEWFVRFEAKFSAIGKGAFSVVFHTSGDDCKYESNSFSVNSRKRE